MLEGSDIANQKWRSNTTALNVERGKRDIKWNFHRFKGKFHSHCGGCRSHGEQDLMDIPPFKWSFLHISKKNPERYDNMLYIWSVIGGQNFGLKSAWWEPHKWCLPGQCCKVLWGKFKGQYLQSVESWFVKLLMAKLFPFIAHSPPFFYNYLSTRLIWKCFNCTFFSNHPVFISVCNIVQS